MISDKHPKKRSHKEGEITAHWIVLLFCVFILLGAAVLSPPRPDSPFLHIGPLPIPDMCSFKNLTGWPCPGCGLTRSMVEGQHAGFQASFRYHRLGLLTLGYVWLQFFYRLGAIVFPLSITGIIGFAKILNKGIILLAGLFLLNWVCTLFL